MSETVIELKDVGFMYEIANTPTFKNLNLEIKKGEFVGLVGMNGVGKTTLCNLIRGIIPNFIKGEVRGEILIEGKNINEYTMGMMAEKIGFVFQNPFIQISGIKKTVFEEIAYGLENLGVTREEMIDRVNNILTQLKIEYLKDKHPAELSGGQSQRVALASVLVMEPDILLVDEPTSQLDPIGTEEVFETLAILKEQHKTIILVEHKIDLISQFSDRVIVMGEEGIVLDGKTHEVLATPLIENYGISMPQVTKLAYKMKDAQEVKFENIPTTIDNAEVEFRKVLKI